jgi:hypothetical protein
MKDALYKSNLYKKGGMKDEGSDKEIGKDIHRGCVCRGRRISYGTWGSQGKREHIRTGPDITDPETPYAIKGTGDRQVIQFNKEKEVWKMKGLLKKMERIFTAAAFAEAGEYHMAHEILREDERTRVQDRISPKSPRTVSRA